MSGLERSELARADEWLALAQTLNKYDPDALIDLGFSERDHELIERLIPALRGAIDEDIRALAESMLVRIAELCPDRGWFTRRVINAIHAEDERW